MNHSTFLRGGENLPKRLSRAWLALSACALMVSAGGASAQENLSLKGHPIASSETGDVNATNPRAIVYLNDNDVSTRWQGVNLQGEWGGIQWDTPVTLNKIVVQTAYDRYKGYKIQSLKAGGSIDNDADWVDVATGAGAGTGNIQLQPIHTADLAAPITTTAVRFLILDSVDQGGIREFQTFLTETNLSLQGTPVGSSESGDVNATNPRAIVFANDGKTDTRWQPATRQNEWIGIKWANPVTFNKVVVKTAYDRFKAYKIQILKAGGDPANDADFTDIAGGDLPGTGNIQVQPIYSVLLPQPVTTTMVRFYIPDSVELGGVRELETFNVAAGTISGVVTEAGTNKPLAGVQIVAAPGDVTVTTDAAGKYSLVLQSGTFDVRATKPATGADGGFFARSVGNLKIDSGATVAANFSLTPSVNLARSATADASTESEAANPDTGDLTENAAKANDGDTNTFWRTSGGSTDEWLRLTWAQPQTYNFLVVQEAGDLVANWLLQSLDKAKNDFTTVGSGTGIASGDTRLDYSFAALSATPLTSDQVRFFIQTGVGTPGVREFQVYNVATGTVKGKVVDASSKAALAGIRIKAVAGPLTINTTTDASGAFTLQVPVGPTVDIVADRLQTPSAAGYVENIAKGVSVSSGGTATGEIEVNVAPTNLAFTAKASASTEEADHEAGKANDGLTNTTWRYEDGDTDRWLQYDWTTAQTFNRVFVAGIGQIPGFDVNAFNETTQAFERVGGGDHAVPVPGTENIVVDLKNPVTTKQLQVVVSGPLGQKPSINEVQVFNVAEVAPPKIPVFTEGGTVMLGDLNGDGKINVQDATLSLRIAVGTLTPTDAQKAAGDVNGDGKWNVQDTTLILRRGIGAIPKFPIEP